MDNQEIHSPAASKDPGSRTSAEAALPYDREHPPLPLTFENGKPVFVFEREGVIEILIETTVLCEALADAWMPGSPTKKEQAAYGSGDVPEAFHSNVHPIRITLTPKSLRFTSTTRGITRETEVSLPEALENVSEAGLAFLVPQKALKGLFTEPGKHYYVNGEHKISKKQWQSRGYDSIEFDENSSYLAFTKSDSHYLNVAVKKVPVNSALPSVSELPDSVKWEIKPFHKPLTLLEFLFIDRDAEHCQQFASFCDERMVAWSGNRGIIYENKDLRGLEFQFPLQNLSLLRSMLNNLTAPYHINVGQTRTLFEDAAVKLALPTDKVGRAARSVDKYLEQRADNTFEVGIVELIKIRNIAEACVEATDAILFRIAKSGEQLLIAAEGASKKGSFKTNNVCIPGGIVFPEEGTFEFKIAAGDFMRAVLFFTTLTVSVSVFETFVRFSEITPDHKFHFAIGRNI